MLAVLGSELLLALSFVRLWGDANSAAFHDNVIDAVLDQPFWGTALSRHVIAFVASLVLVHCVLGVAAWSLGALSRLAWPKGPNSLRVWTLFWLAVLAAWIFAANAARFPGSSLGNPYAGALSAAWHGVTLFHVLTAGIGALLAWTLARAIRARLRSLPPVKWIAGGIAASAVVGSSAFALSTMYGRAAATDRPHVIVIGLDSLRPDALHDAHGRNVAPALNEFLSESTVFSDTLTPLARTFPAWVSIISGKHPHTTGALINLLTRDLIDEGDTLPRLLRKAGYRSVYATDETRFSNLDETYGFDEVLAPPMGASDFLLAFFSDTPLANLLVNTKAGEFLFPYAYANRAMATTYDPDTFIERLNAHLSFDEPTFLAVHLTLSHWPYTWAEAPRPAGDGDNADLLTDLYRRSVPRLDAQFGDLVRLLRSKGALERAVVVVLSDHGEALGERLPISRDVHARRHMRSLELIRGHGSNVFAESQYRVLLAVRSFGATDLPTRPGWALDAPASLEDVAPTLADALGVSPERPFDGLSWLPQLEGAPVGEREHRIRYIESEFVPPGFEAGAGVILPVSVLKSASGYYRVDGESDRVMIRGDRLGDLLENRQYAATLGDRLLAAVPSDDKREQHVVYLEHPEAEPKWFRTAPAPDDRAYDLWMALRARFSPVRERPIAAPLGDADQESGEIPGG